MRGFGWVLVLGLFLLQAGTWWAGRSLGGKLPPEGVGNRVSQRESLLERPLGSPYRFAFLGDPEGTRTGQDLVAALAAEKPDFLVLTGDVMHGGGLPYHQMAAEWLEGLGELSFPLFWVVGNRDIAEGSFDMEDFEKRYGPTNSWFSHGGDLFVLIRLADPFWSPNEGLYFLREVLAAERARHRRVFVFSHAPPSVSEVLDTRHGGRGLLPHTTDWFRETCREYSVDYFLSSHFHGYTRSEIDGTVYLVSGGGGSVLHDPEDRTGHHGMLLEVGPEGVEERTVTRPARIDPVWRLREMLVGEVAPRLFRWPWLVLLGDLLLLGILLRFAPLRRSPPPALP